LWYTGDDADCSRGTKIEDDLTPQHPISDRGVSYPDGNRVGYKQQVAKGAAAAFASQRKMSSVDEEYFTAGEETPGDAEDATTAPRRAPVAAAASAAADYSSSSSSSLSHTTDSSSTPLSGRRSHERPGGITRHAILALFSLHVYT